MYTKKPLQSRRIQGLVIAAIGIVANILSSLFGWEVNTEAASGLVNMVFENWDEIVTAVGILWSFIGQVRATKMIDFSGGR